MATVRWKVQAFLFKTAQVRIPGLTHWISVAHDYSQDPGVYVMSQESVRKTAEAN
jgi:hypothetical protein